MSDDRKTAAALAHRLRELLYEGIAIELEIDGHCKSYEGAVDVIKSFPSYFERDEPTLWIVRVHCYLLGPGRHYEWQDEDLTKALGRAVLQVEEWVEESRERHREEFADVDEHEPRRASGV